MLNTAQRLVQGWTENGNLNRDYKAPHAYRGTPQKPARRHSNQPKLLKGLRA